MNFHLMLGPALYSRAALHAKAEQQSHCHLMQCSALYGLAGLHAKGIQVTLEVIAGQPSMCIKLQNGSLAGYN